MQDGYCIINDVYTPDEVKAIIDAIAMAGTDKPTFRKTDDLFAIRQFLKEIPEVAPIIFNDKLSKLINDLFGDGYFVVKSIYFDKPGASNWFVAYHQDLTISVDSKKKIQKAMGLGRSNISSLRCSHP